LGLDINPDRNDQNRDDLHRCQPDNQGFRANKLAQREVFETVDLRLARIRRMIGNRKNISLTAPFFAWVFTSLIAMSQVFLSPVLAIQEKKSANDQLVDFDVSIKPILSDRCYVCHGPDGETRQAGLRLDTEDGAATVIEGGDADGSALIERITSDDPDLKMPPPDSKIELSQQEIELVQKWIDQGAEWKLHWAFVRPKQPTVPKMLDEKWCRNEIDHFILQRLDEAGQTSAARADRATLARRLAFDLTGLPPTIEQLDSFLDDNASNAYETYVDMLLASPAYGERMASEWLDSSRYSDTYGYQVDRDRFVWPWRDWVIGSLNENKPYDRFITEQLAGDLLPNATDDQILATTFNRLHPQKVEGGSVEEEFRVEYVADRLHTMSTAMLGLTMECCRCHDHKFDPFSQKEYYQLFSFFNNINEAGLYSFFTPNSIPTPSLLLIDEAKQKELDKLKANVDKETAELSKIENEFKTAQTKLKQWLASRQELLAAADTEPANDVKPIEWVAGLIKPIDLKSLPRGQNKLVDGPVGEPESAIKLTGDDEVKLDVGNFDRFQPFSISTWVWTPDVKERAVIFHRSRAWTDAASRGYELLILDGKLQASLIHFWPGNAISVAATETLPTKEWSHVVLVYDGSNRAAGIQLFLDGKQLKTKIVRDSLTKTITGGDEKQGNDIAFGARFRDRGFTGGRIADVKVFDRQIIADEVKHLHDGVTLKQKVEGEDISVLSDVFFAAHYEPAAAQREKILSARKAWCDAYDTLDEIMVMAEMDTPRQAHVLGRGEYSNLQDPVDPQPPEIFPPLPDGQPANRLALAKWLTTEHPLTSRVAVNRYWQICFGEGLVRTPEDFGRQGKAPTHPELLDWLALDFEKHGWDIKRLMKQIVMSSTYQQSSESSDKSKRIDPANELLSHAPRHRLTAEMIRDQVLAVSGLMVDRIGGKPVKPYEVAVSFKPVAHDKDEGLYRRSLYTYWKRTGPAPVMTTFDAAKRDVCRVKRERTSSPLQALVMLNGPQYVEAGRGIAVKLLEKYGDEQNEIINEMFRMVTSESATEKQRSIIAELFQEQLNYFESNSEAVEKYLGVGNWKANPESDPETLAAWSAVANTLLNLDQTMTKR
jgi:hypothetical protein